MENFIFYAGYIQWRDTPKELKMQVNIFVNHAVQPGLKNINLIKKAHNFTALIPSKLKFSPSKLVNEFCEEILMPPNTFSSTCGNQQKDLPFLGKSYLPKIAKCQTKANTVQERTFRKEIFNGNKEQKAMFPVVSQSETHFYFSTKFFACPTSEVNLSSSGFPDVTLCELF